MVAGLLAAAVAIAGWAVVCRRRPAIAAVVLVGFVAAWSHVLALAYAGGVDADVVRVLISVKDVGAVVLALVLVTRELRSPTTSRWLVGPACLLFLSVVPALVVGLVDESPGDIALSARNAAVPILALVTGLLLSDEERRTVVSGAAVVLAVAALYAMLELTFPLR